MNSTHSTKSIERCFHYCFVNPKGTPCTSVIDKAAIYTELMPGRTPRSNRQRETKEKPEEDIKGRREILFYLYTKREKLT